MINGRYSTRSHRSFGLVGYLQIASVTGFYIAKSRALCNMETRRGARKSIWMRVRGTQLPTQTQLVAHPAPMP
jgi:hypothetical protein